MEELIAAVVGAIVGAVIAAAVAFGQQHLARGAARKDERERERRALAREIMRKRLDQKELVGPLNEIPLVFGDDSTTRRLYNEVLNAANPDERTEALAGLVNRIAELTGLPTGVSPNEITRGFEYRG